MPALCFKNTSPNRFPERKQSIRSHTELVIGTVVKSPATANGTVVKPRKPVIGTVVKTPEPSNGTVVNPPKTAIGTDLQ